MPSLSMKIGSPANSARGDSKTLPTPLSPSSANGSGSSGGLASPTSTGSRVIRSASEQIVYEIACKRYAEYRQMRDVRRRKLSEIRVKKLTADQLDPAVEQMEEKLAQMKNTIIGNLLDHDPQYCAKMAIATSVADVKAIVDAELARQSFYQKLKAKYKQMIANDPAALAAASPTAASTAAAAAAANNGTVSPTASPPLTPTSGGASLLGGGTAASAQAGANVHNSLGVAGAALFKSVVSTTPDGGGKSQEAVGGGGKSAGQSSSAPPPLFSIERQSSLVRKKMRASLISSNEDFKKRLVAHASFGRDKNNATAAAASPTAAGTAAAASAAAAPSWLVTGRIVSLTSVASSQLLHVCDEKMNVNGAADGTTAANPAAMWYVHAVDAEEDGKAGAPAERVVKFESMYARGRYLRIGTEKHLNSDGKGGPYTELIVHTHADTGHDPTIVSLQSRQWKLQTGAVLHVGIWTNGAVKEPAETGLGPNGRFKVTILK